MAGAEIWAGNELYNAITGNSDTLRLSLGNGSNLDFSQYIRTEIDMRRYWQVAPNRSIAARFSFGIARSFGFTSDVPYVKQFFAGGPVSVRAWAPRGLGPGAYEDPLSRDTRNNTRLYQTGDISLEANLEYRFKIFWLLNGALFLDAGNVWTIDYDANRCGSQFLISPQEYTDCIDEEGNVFTQVNEAFYRQIAVGGGFGLRFDFSYFILRLDLATKLRHSYPFMPDETGATESDYWFRDFREGYSLSKVAFNLGFGYPF
jgi:outer membrane protein assembly factor BamA